MQEENEILEENAHTSYKEYKQQLEKKKNEHLILFVVAFFVMLLLFLGVVKQLSPDIDVSISDNQNDDTISEQVNVDDRLKDLQNEDNSIANKNDETFSPELEEKVIIPKQKQESEDVITLQETLVKQQPQTKSIEQAKPVVNVVPVTAKVVVGHYATAEQAEAAKTILMDANLNIQPFVRNLNGSYTLQAGSFSSKEKAQSLVNDLLNNNFPARLILE